VSALALAVVLVLVLAAVSVLVLAAVLALVGLLEFWSARRPASA
jgi:hypothetical protein